MLPSKRDTASTIRRGLMSILIFHEKKNEEHKNRKRKNKMKFDENKLECSTNLIENKSEARTEKKLATYRTENVSELRIEKKRAANRT